MKPIINRKTHTATSNEEALRALRAKYPMYQDVIDLILEHREKAKLVDAFLNSKLSNRGRLQTSYNAAGTVTGRISSQKTIFGMGANHQQTPKGSFRQMFIAPEGKVLIKADLSQADARAVAWFARIDGLIFNFLKPEFDVHCWTASLFLNKPIDKVTEEERQNTKGIVHGLNYGRGAKSISIKEKILFREVKFAIALYHKTLPQLKQWHQRIENELFKCRRLRTPLGRLRIFMDRLNAETFRSAYAFQPQSLVGDIINQAFFKLDELLPKECFSVLQIHDEVVIEALVEKKDECIDIIRKECEIEINVPPITVPLKIPAKVYVGKNWHDMTEIKRNERKFP